MKVYKGMLQDMKSHKGIERYHNGEIYKKVLKIYNKLILEYYGGGNEYGRRIKRVVFPKEEVMNERHKRNKRKLTKKAKKARFKMNQIKKIVNICRKLDVDIESYMKAQFRLVYPELKKVKPNSVLGLGRLISPLAVERFTQLATGKEKKLSIDETVRIKKKKGINIERCMLASIRVLERRLLVVQKEIELDPDIVNEELMRLLRFKKISKVYIYSSDFIEKHGNKKLKIIQKVYRQRLGMKQKGEVDGFKYRYKFNQEVKEYVR